MAPSQWIIGILHARLLGRELHPHILLHSLDGVTLTS